MVLTETHNLTEFDALIASATGALDAIPGAVYLCDHNGLLLRFNQEAASLWGREPRLADPSERFCGSFGLYYLDGSPLRREDTPMATALLTGEPARNFEVVMERPDGQRFVALVNIRALKDHQGRIQGAINCFQDITVQKKIEEEVHRKRQELEDFFENSAIGLHIVADDGIIKRANRAELDMLGYMAEEYIGRHISEFHADPPVIDDILKRLSCGKELNRYPARLRAKDGSIKHVLITSNGRFQDGQFINTRCFTTDITEQYEAEKARRDSDERLEATYEVATVGIAETDDAGRLVRVNQMLCTITGYSRDELLSRSLLDLAHPEDAEKEALNYKRQVSGEIDSYATQGRYVRADGCIIYVDAFNSSVRDEHGRFRYGVRVIQDVTERRLANERVRESERRIRELLEALPAAVYTIDARGNVNFYNKAAVELAGRTPVLDQDQWCVSWRLHWPDGQPLAHHACPMAMALKEGRAIRGMEAVAERPDGTRVPFMAYPTPLWDHQGKLVGAVNMLVDITERKQAEARQKVLIDELNHRVKNTLATVQSLALQTARYATTFDGFIDAFEARLIALARAHDLLTKHHWESAGLRDILAGVLAPYANSAPERLQMNGPAVEVDPRTSVALTLVFNELATNAGKYGSLSHPAGVLSLQWKVESGPGASMLHIEWLEAGGPPVTVPTRSGFGSRLIKRCIERELSGELSLQYDPTGLYCQISIPLNAIPTQVHA